MNDRRSFEEFVGLGVINDIPDATTVDFFGKCLRKANVKDELFKMFESNLRDQGLEALDLDTSLQVALMKKE